MILVEICEIESQCSWWTLLFGIYIHELHGNVGITSGGFTDDTKNGDGVMWSFGFGNVNTDVQWRVEYTPGIVNKIAIWMFRNPYGSAFGLLDDVSHAYYNLTEVLSQSSLWTRGVWFPCSLYIHRGPFSCSISIYWFASQSSYQLNGRSFLCSHSTHPVC